MLNKKFRLTKNGSFNYVYRKGSGAFAQNVKITYVVGKGNLPKIGFSVNNKIGCAVIRNKVRRRMRAICRMFMDNIAPAQIVFTALKGVDTLTFDELKLQMLKLLKKSNLYNEKNN